MDPQRHAELSARRRGGVPADYYAAHSALDVTKELCSDNRHRVFHTIWGIRRLALPLLGPVIRLTGGGTVYTKDVLEFDHVLPDFRNRFIPTLGDFVAALDPRAVRALELRRDPRARFRAIHAPFRDHPDAMRLLLSPYAVTGDARALVFTHNTFFLTELLPRLCPDVPAALPDGIPPAEIFAPMRFLPWMDNGDELPPSYPLNAREVPAPCS